LRYLRECIIVGGRTSGNNVLGKTRDRNYTPSIEIVRELLDDGLEILYLHDKITDYSEGMNSNGVGIVNSALLVSDDENAVQLKAKSKNPSRDGKRIRHALSRGSLKDVMQALVSYDGGVKGHTIVGDPKSLYSIEVTSKNKPIITKLDPMTGFDVRTNHGVEHPTAGYSPKRRPDDYLSSKMRHAQADIEIADIDDYEKLMPALAKQHFEPDSNLNMRRSTDNMRSTSQVMMNLDKKEFLCYLFPEECDYRGYVDKTPPAYNPKINLRVIQYKD